MSLQKKRDKLAATNKETRWDRIRKRQQSGSNQVSLKTDAVRRFIERDYIGEHNAKLLINGDERIGTRLNPSIVMDMRHQMFQKIPRKLPLATAAYSKDLSACITHNLEVEQRFIANELNKFRQQLAKHHKQHEIRQKPGKPNLKLDNTPIMESLESTSKHIEDFYAAPVEALEKAVTLYTGDTNMIKHAQNADEDELAKEQTSECELIVADDSEILKIKAEYAFESVLQMPANNDDLMTRCRTPSPLTPTDEFFKPMRAAAERQMLHMRCVRFEEEVGVRKIQRETSSCSNTSDGIDSVISDLAEEALLELQMEAEDATLQPVVEIDTTEVTEATCPIKTELREQQHEPQLHESKIPEVVAKPQTKTQTKRTADEQQELQAEQEIAESLYIRRLEPPKVLIKPKTDESCEVLSSGEEEEEEESSISNREQNNIIGKLFQARSHTNKATMRKYFRMWIHYTTIEKLERENCKVRSDRVQKINTFLDNIRKQKKNHRIAQQQRELNELERPLGGNKSSNKSTEQREEALKMTKQFKNKIKVQQDIIDLQRVKLERQERMIMELKLHKLTDEANDARQELKQELKAVIRCGDPKSKAKAKCLQLIGSLRDDEDEALARLQGKSLLQPKFLQNMQERAVERSVRHEQARQRRMQAEAEREAQKTALEEAKRLEDEEAKKLRIEVLKEKRRQEKMAKIIRERERQRAIENHRKAKEFCRRLLLRRVGMEGFRRLIERKHDNQRKCDELRCKLYKRNYFIAWREYTCFLRLQKEVKADKCYEKAQKRHALEAWKIYVQEEHSKMLVAIDWHAMRLVEHNLQRWSNYTQQARMIEDTKMRQAISHHEWHLKWKVLDCWQRLPQILQLEKETEERRQRWRMKIWELLPDYKPNRDEENLW